MTQSEKDIWYNQRLACLADLNSWRTILEDTLLEVTDDNSQEPKYMRLWEPPKQDLYLGLFIRGALKVETYHNALSEFVQMSLDDPPKRKFLLDQFGTHLATLAAINGEWDRARFHLGQCYKTFRKGWSALHPLALEGRHLQVRQLQKTVELDEFVNFISDGHCNNLPRFLPSASLTSLKNVVSQLCVPVDKCTRSIINVISGGRGRAKHLLPCPHCSLAVWAVSGH